MEKIVTKSLLDKSLFNTTIQVLACKIPIKILGEFQKKFKKFLLKIPYSKNVLSVADDESQKFVLLCKEFGTKAESLPEQLQTYVKEKEIEVLNHDLELNYQNFSCHEALEKILPEGVMIPTGFETVGHIAHMNLGEEHMEYKHHIGQIFLDKNPSIKTVITKVGFIENVYRTFNFEVLAGEELLETTQIEDNIKFDVDISKVYWCSRLGQERIRVVKEFFNAGDVICDMFCGIGPLSIKAAKEKGLKVLANDLNPD